MPISKAPDQLNKRTNVDVISQANYLDDEQIYVNQLPMNYDLVLKPSASPKPHMHQF